MVFRCCVPECYFNGTGKRLASFPINNAALLKIWIKNLNIPKMMEESPSKIYKKYRICEKHFEKKWIQTGWYPGSSKPVLYKGAVPTLYLGKDKPVQDVESDREDEVSISSRHTSEPTCVSPLNLDSISGTSTSTSKKQVEHPVRSVTGKYYYVQKTIPDEHGESSETEVDYIVECATPDENVENPAHPVPGKYYYVQKKIPDECGDRLVTEEDYIVQYSIPDDHAECPVKEKYYFVEDKWADIPLVENLSERDALLEEHDLTVQKSWDSSRCADQMKKRTNAVENDTRPAKKLKTDEVLNRQQGYCILNFITVFAAISSFVNCKECQKEVKFSKTDAFGLGFQIALECNCGVRYINSCTRINNALEINRRIVLAMRLLGVALNGLNLFCAIMDLGKGFTSNMYHNCIEVIKTASQVVYDFSTHSAIEEEKKLNAASKDPCHLCVSGDGMWEKRGIASVFGFTTLTGQNTGRIVDAVVKLNYCAECSAWSTKRDSSEYDKWCMDHKKICTVMNTRKINAGSKKEMFRRSKIKFGVLYTTFVEQGDYKTLKLVNDYKYCYNITAQKKVCVSHAEKFMAFKLRSARKTMGDNQNFTDELIDDLATCYGLAIKRNSHSFEDMKRAVWADIYHKISTNERPQHERCPVGPESWCHWRQAEANGTLDTYEHEAPLDEKIVQVIWPIYESSSTYKFLIRYVGAYTWHSNQPLKAMIRKFVPKHLHANKDTVDLAIMLAVCIFNDGLDSILKIMQTMGITIGPHAAELAETLDVRSQRSDQAPARTAAREWMLAQNDTYEVE